jgi:hypothetical protein
VPGREEPYRRYRAGKQPVLVVIEGMPTKQGSPTAFLRRDSRSAVPVAAGSADRSEVDKSDDLDGSPRLQVSPVGRCVDRLHLPLPDGSRVGMHIFHGRTRTNDV